MTLHAYTEDQLVEQPAIGLFAPWMGDDVFPWRRPSATAHWGKRPGAVVLTERLCTALCRFNPTPQVEAISTAIDELIRDLLLRLSSGQMEISHELE